MANPLLMAEIFDNINEGIYILNRKGDYIYCNNAFLKMVGATREEALSLNAFQLIPEGQVSVSVAVTAFTEKKKVSVVNNVLTPKGYHYRQLATATPIFGSGGEVEYMLVETVRLDLLAKRYQQAILYEDDSTIEVPALSPERARAKETIIADSPAMQAILQTAAQVAQTDSTVLISGESGTGKELVVSSIHNASYRKDKTFMPINCAALPESILESLLFGTRRGAFTGAEDRVGLIEECSGGTIYLDEINSMPLKLQSKLLRVLDTKTVMALGASKPKEVDIRIVASVNRSPEQLMQNKEMLPDLFYRLNAIHIRVPPLRSRPEDIELLAQHFLDSYNRQLGKQNNGISPEAMELLKTYHWPGNVRELEHTIEAALNLTDGSRELRVEDIPAYFFSPAGASAAGSGGANARSVPNVPLREAVADYERGLIRQALQEAKGNIDRAAALLQIPRTTLYSRMSKLGLR